MLIPRFVVDLEDSILHMNPYDTDKKGPYIPIGVLPKEIMDDIKRIINEVKEEQK